MGTFESARGGLWCSHQPLTVWQYTDAARLQIGAVVQGEEADARPGDDASIRPHLEMMTGGAANKLRAYNRAACSRM